MAQTQRQKPYSRPSGGSDSVWKHDLHPNSSSSSRNNNSLASRLSSSASSSSASRTSLQSRISGFSTHKGKELLSSSSTSTSTATPVSQLHGYSSSPLPNINNPNSGVELFPSTSSTSQQSAGLLKNVGKQPGERAGRFEGRSVFGNTIIATGLAGQQEQPHKPTRERSIVSPPTNQQSHPRELSIVGMGKIIVKVENLALGTTADDVKSAFAPSPIIAARQTSSSPLITIELEYTDKSAAELLISQYNGIVADGNTLKLSLVRPGLSERLGSGQKVPQVQNGTGSTGGGLSGRLGGSGGQQQGSSRVNGNVRNVGNGSSGGRELIDGGSSSKMYSDTILRTNQGSAIVTVNHDEITQDQSQRKDAWLRGGPSQTNSLGGRFGQRGRGQIGGGSYADMMID